MKKIVLKVVKQCVSTEGITSEYVKLEILPRFFVHFWNTRSAADKRINAQLGERSHGFVKFFSPFFPPVFFTDLVSVLINLFPSTISLGCAFLCMGLHPFLPLVCFLFRHVSHILVVSFSGSKENL